MLSHASSRADWANHPQVPQVPLRCGHVPNLQPAQFPQIRWSLSAVALKTPGACVHALAVYPTELTRHTGAIPIDHCGSTRPRDQIDLAERSAAWLTNILLIANTSKALREPLPQGLGSCMQHAGGSTIAHRHASKATRSHR